MKLNEVMTRLSGISCPLFGVSWNPPEPQRVIAREVIAYLENRRLFYRDDASFLVARTLYDNHKKLGINYGAFMPYAVNSAIQTRYFLTGILPRVGENSVLSHTVRSIRRACRVFVEESENLCCGSEIIINENSSERNLYYLSRSKLQNVVGSDVGKIIIAYGIEEVDDELAMIIPET